MIVCIRTHVESIGSKWQCQKILVNIASDMGASIMYAYKYLQSNSLKRMLKRSDSISKYLMKPTNNWG